MSTWGRSTSTTATLLLVNQSSQKFFLHPAEIIVDQVCFQFLISQPVFKIYAVKLESCSKSGRIFDFLALPNFWRKFLECKPPKNLYISDNAHFKARHVAKYRGATPATAKVIGTVMLNFNAILDPPLKKIERWTFVSGGGCASNIWSFSSVCKNLGMQHP